jgi:ATP-binding cassette subfamily C protein CydCD
VTYTYPGRTEPALRGLDLAVPPRGLVALVGPSGAGKSTVAAMLLRFIEPDGGAILAGDVPLGAIELAAWRAHVAWVPQRPHLFHGSIADNVRLARPDADDRAVAAALTSAGAASFVDGLPLRAATQVGDDGVRLSGGQRQRIAIARAILADARLIVMDEATSHLDAASVETIRAAVVDLARDRAVLVVSHRLRLAAFADTVAVVEAGRVVESGSPRELLARGGVYARLVAANDADPEIAA